jgi:minor histocompatibility antigen H13
MVTVATSLDMPIKLLWPRSILSLAPLSLLPAPSKPNMLLGLGDVVIPGTLVALAYRLDMHMKQKGKGGGEYLKATIVGYFVGLSMAFAAMHVFRAAQPALLYLRCVFWFIWLGWGTDWDACSPTCCLSFIFNAVQRNELGYVWGWEDGAEEEKEKEEREKKEKKEKEGKES